MRSVIRFVQRGERSWREFVLAILLVVVAGCEKQTETRPLQIGPGPSAPAAYGLPTAAASSQVARARPPTTNDDAWKHAAFSVLQTELSPAIVVHSQGRHLNLFSDLKRRGLGPPSQVAWSTKDGPRTFARGTEMDVTRMEENWVLVWFAGAEGWTNWDSPWGIFVQHHPTSLRLDEAGLHISFPELAGDVAMMPLYGYYKPSPTGHDSLAEHGLPSKKLRTWEWTNGIPREPLTRLRYWAGATREIPIYCEDSFSVDRSKDSVTIRSRFDYHSIPDDWNTKPIRLAPLSPPLGLAVKLGGLPIQLSQKHFDFELTTPFGPYLAIQNADTFDATFAVLQYVNETQTSKPPGTNAPLWVGQDLANLPSGQRVESPTDAMAALIDVANLARVLPEADAATRSNAVARLRRRLLDDFLVTDRFQAIGTTGELIESPEFSATLLEAVWVCAHFSGDWEMVRQRWPIIRRLFRTGSGAGWAKFSRGASASAASEAGACVAFARLAYRAGDIDSYNYACALFARELVLVFDKQRGADYFRKEQPWHSMEFMDDEVFLTSLRGDSMMGWNIDGPRYPAKAARREFEGRWLDFDNPDLARFFRERLSDDVQRESNWIGALSKAGTGSIEGAAARVSLTTLRSLRVTNVASGSGSAIRYARLIPGGSPSPFVPGPEREVAGPNTTLAYLVENQAFDSRSGQTNLAWPQPVWPAWRTPTGAPWSFGHIQPVRTSEPWNVRLVPLNWNTRVLVYEKP